jgi:tRNA-splicing ligase RtcB
MKTRSLEALGVPPALTRMAKWHLSRARAAGLGQREARDLLRAILAHPDAHRGDPHLGRFAEALARLRGVQEAAATPSAARDRPAPWRQWGSDIDAKAVEQMRAAMMLPVAAAGALMPDAHLGYGLPIGGVLATENAVIPYAVGVDIACRMKLSVLDLPGDWLESKRDVLALALERETRFGMGAEFGGRGDPYRSRPREHEVLDDDWSVSPVTAANRERARLQLGTSGSGNHFVEFGTLTLEPQGAAALGLATGGDYLALLSHSGSRGTGAAVCDHYSRLAMERHPALAREMRHLAWLPLESHEGQEYWAAMELMGRYAAANHAVIHRHVAGRLGAEVIAGVENHHNFAWKEEHELEGGRREVVVHRKGATPAAAGVLGMIPGSMAAPGYLVRGRGVAAALDSASHGAGRRMSRTQARQTYRWPQVRDLLARRGVQLLSAGIDEVPHAYKDIDAVMAAQIDLVETLGRFDPKLVKMAPEGEKPED